MYIIEKNNNISLNRGDYLEFPVSLESGIFPFKTSYILEEGDVVLFGLMYPHQPFEEAILKKEFTYKDQVIDEDGDALINIVIEPEDTLELLPGKYYYSIKIIYQEEEKVHVDTIVQKTAFNIID